MLFRSCDGHTVQFPRPIEVCGRFYEAAVVLREIRSKSKAKVLSFQPGDAMYICKFENLNQEMAVMAVLQAMNRRWLSQGVHFCGEPVHAITYGIWPLGPEAGLVEVVLNSRTLGEITKDCPQSERHLRVLRALRGDRSCWARLGASVVAYVTACYVLGIRDGHNDNLMIRPDGFFFRVDFGHAFGSCPVLDAKATFVPNAVTVALGENGWQEVVRTCGHALQALTGQAGTPPGWDVCKNVPQLAPYRGALWAYIRGLSFEDFGRQVRSADHWCPWRAMKNTVREAVAYALHEE